MSKWNVHIEIDRLMGTPKVISNKMQRFVDDIRRNGKSI